MTQTMSKKVFVMLSGGVDSSSSLAILQEKYEVVAVYLKCWSQDQIQKLNLTQDLYDCSWEDDLMDAKIVAKKLKTPFEVWDLQEEYLQKVVDYMLKSYQLGLTPNPDIMCNSQIKFGVFAKKAFLNGADLVASGHYARSLEVLDLKENKDFDKDFGGLNFKYSKILARGKDKEKDQSYFLCRVKPEIFEKTLFPAGDFESKQALRDFAKQKNLITADKKDSQGLCFVGKTSLREMLKQKIGQKEGKIINESNDEILGSHPGSHLYTIGQRNNLGLSGGPWFVSKIDIQKNLVFIKHGDYKNEISSQKITANNLNLFINLSLNQKIQAKAQVRYRQEAVDCEFYLTSEDELTVEFVKPVWAISKGQSVVLYRKELVLGSGVID
jgi:tRNA-specific 2-thiouridylase